VAPLGPRPSLRGLHPAFESGGLSLAVRELRLLVAQRVRGPLRPRTQALFARRGVSKLSLQALELSAGLAQAPPLRRPGALPRRADRGGAERRSRLLSVDPAAQDALAQLRVAGCGPERLADQLEGTRARGMAGVAGARLGGLDDCARRFALSLGGGAPFGRSLVLPLERPALGVLELAAGLGELLHPCRCGERGSVDQPGRDGGAPQLLHPAGLVAVAGGAQVLGEPIPPGNEPFRVLAVELVETLVGFSDHLHGCIGEISPRSSGTSRNVSPEMTAPGTACCVLGRPRSAATRAPGVLA